ncbi:MAG: ATP-binding cassette domain-containing protein, partial [Erysipelotrichaceae bacterium]
METIVSVKKLTKHYGDIQAVKGIEFEVERGSFFAFLGPNGAGKSTTVNMLVTLLAQSGGEASVCGYELGKEDDGIRRNIGVVFQTSHLDGLLSVKENILLRARMYGMNKKDAVKQLEHLAKKLGIDDL